MIQRRVGVKFSMGIEIVLTPLSKCLELEGGVQRPETNHGPQTVFHKRRVAQNPWQSLNRAKQAI
jgi:hypothetical protein